MAITERVDSRPVEHKRPLPKRAVEVFLRSGVGRRTVHGFIDRIFEHGPQRLFDWEGLENLDLLKDHIGQDAKVVLVANHTSHADAVPVVKLLTEIRSITHDPSRSIVYTMAGSMKKEQGIVVESMFTHGVEPYFRKVGITPDYVVSENDRVERLMDRPEDNGKLTRDAMVDSCVISAVHIEGKTKGGKINPETNRRFGLQEMDRGFKAILIGQINKKIPTLIVPVIIEGADLFFNPATKNFTPEGLNTILESLIVGEGTKVGNAMDMISRLWYGDVMRYRPATVRIGEPKMLQEIYTRAPELCDNVMRLLARVASPQYRGEYGDKLLAKSA